MATVTACMAGSCTKSQINYPTAPADNTVDEYFGMKVDDRYRPLENDTADATLKWVDEENKITQEYLNRIPFRDKLRNRLTELNNYKKTGLPWKESDGKYYFYENDGLQNQSVLYRTDSIGGKAELFLDPNKLSDDGTVALTGVSQSNDGRYTAYTISRNGSDWTEIYVIDTKTGELLPDHIEWAKFTSAQWKGDGFYYSAYPRPEAGKEFSNANENHQIYYHKMGTPQSQDILAYEDKANPLHFHTAWVPESEDYLFAFAGGQGFGESLMYKNLKTNSGWTILEPSQNYEISPLGVIDDKLYAKTSKGAERYRVVMADLNASTPQWQEIVPEQDAVLASAQFAGDKMLLTYEKDAASHVYTYTTAIDRKSVV